MFLSVGQNSGFVCWDFSLWFPRAMMRVVTTWDKEINSDFLGTFLGFLLQHKDADLISHSINSLLSDDCQRLLP